MPSIPRHEVERMVVSYVRGELPPLNEELSEAAMSKEDPSNRTVGVELEADWRYAETAQNRKVMGNVPAGVSETQLLQALSVLRSMSQAEEDEEFLDSHNARFWHQNLPVSPEFNPAEFYQRLRNTEIRDQINAMLGVSNEERRWECKSDGSVTCGWEIVSPPFKKDSGFRNLRRVLEYMRDIGLGPFSEQQTNPDIVARRECGHQTGMHVHVDASDLSDLQCGAVVAAHRYFFKRLRKLYPNVLPEHRENGNYCRHIEFIYQQQGLQFNFETKVGDIYAINHGSAHSRYTEVNSHSRREHGTLEFRAGYMCLNPDEVDGYVKHLRSLLDWAAKRRPMFNANTPVGAVVEDYYLTFGDFEGYRELFLDSPFASRGVLAAIQRRVPDMDRILSSRPNLSIYRDLLTMSPTQRTRLLGQLNLVRSINPTHPQLRVWDYTLARFEEDQEAIRGITQAA